jgi:hypothetical protein
MLGAMRAWPLLVAIITGAGLAACGGSSHSASTQGTATGAASAQTSTLQTIRGTGTGVATTTTSATAPPEVPKARKHTSHGTTHAASQGAHVESNLTVSANGDVSPPVVSVPSGVGVDLHITYHGSGAATVALSVPGHPSVKVAPGGHATLQTGGLKDGTYRILVNGTPRGQVLTGAQGGP